MSPLARRLLVVTAAALFLVGWGRWYDKSARTEYATPSTTAPAAVLIPPTVQACPAGQLCGAAVFLPETRTTEDAPEVLDALRRCWAERLRCDVVAPGAPGVLMVIGYPQPLGPASHE